MAKPGAPRVRLSASLPAKFPVIQLVAPLALLGMALSAPVMAEVRVIPSVSVRETYSDNPGLNPDGGDGQFITDLSPAVNAVNAVDAVTCAGETIQGLVPTCCE